MAELVSLHRRQEPQEIAAAWIVRLDAGLTGDEKARLLEWLHADPQNRAALFELAAVWDELDVLAELSTLFPLEPAVSRRALRLTGRRAIAASAAALTVIAAVAGLFLYQRLQEDTAAGATADATLHFETEVGGHESERLADGSVVTLNTDTALSVEYTSGERRVVLERGEAYFEVAEDPSRPFAAYVGGRIVQAVGTAFNIRLARDGDVEVTVTEGRVKLLDAPQAAATQRAASPTEFDTTLIEGEVALLDEAALPRVMPRITRLTPNEVDIKVAWQRGMLIFEGEPLGAVLTEVMRYTTTEFVLEDERLGDVRVGGYFRAGDIEGLLIALNENFQIGSERVGTDRIVLRPRP